jgi:hypothetical protein
MLGSRKSEKCQCIKKKKNDEGKISITFDKECQKCIEGRVWTSRCYWPEYLLHSDGSLGSQELANLLNPNLLIQPANPAKPPRPDNLFRLMKMASLRTSAIKPNPEFKMPLGAVHHVPFKPSGKSKKRKGGKQQESEPRLHDEDKATLNQYRNKFPFAKNHPWIPLVQKLIVRKFGEYYRNTMISRMILLKGTSKKGIETFMIMVLTSGPGSNFCLNIGQDHNSNTVYFLLDQSGIVQRCHCKCEKVRPSGFKCKDYCSKKISLDDVPNLLNAFFPQMFHSEGWRPKIDRNWGHMPPDFLHVLWNRLTRAGNSNPDGAVDGIGHLDITQEDHSMTPELIAAIEHEILGSQNIVAKEAAKPSFDGQEDFVEPDEKPWDITSTVVDFAAGENIL